MSTPAKRFRIAFSFAGEKRDFVAKVAGILAKQFGEDRILYDKFHKAEFAQHHLGIDLPDLYNKEADLNVVVLCPRYKKKSWCGLEWTAIHALLMGRGKKRVLLTRFEHATVKGLYPTAGFIELDTESPEQVATLILERLAINEGHPKDHYKIPTITDPLHWDRLHPDARAFDHQYARQNWHDLSMKTVDVFLRKDRVERQEDFLLGLTPVEQFRRFKFIADIGSVSIGAYLCFAESPSVTIPAATIRCYSWIGTDTSDEFDDDIESRSGLLQQFEAAMGFLKRALRLGRQIKETGRVKIPEIPLDVLQEVTANALVHRDYETRREGVKISVFDDRVEITSPGLLVPPVTLANITAVSTSHPRNPQIARIFYLSGYVERSGDGIRRITAKFAAGGLGSPKFEETPDACFKVTLPRPSQVRAQVAVPLTLTISTPHNLPHLPLFFGRTEELKKIAEALSPDYRTWGALIDGPGGIGKTSLAIRAALEVPEGLFRQILFVSSKSRKLTADGAVSVTDFVVPGHIEMLNEIARLLKQPDLAKAPESDRARLVIGALKPAQALLILDNLESLRKDDQNRLFEFLSQLPQGCKAIVTSRRRTDQDARIIRLAKLEQDAALALLAELEESRPLLKKAGREDRINVYEETGGNPLLIRWVAGQLGRGRCRTIAAALDLLRSAQRENDPLEFIFGDLLDTFTDAETKVLAALTYFTQPVETKLIAELADISETAAGIALGDLASRALVIPDEEEQHFILVPMAAAFLRNKRPEAVKETGNRLEKRAFALIVENGYSRHDRFPVLDAAWPLLAPALPLLFAMPNPQLQAVSEALKFFLEFSGHWDESLLLSSKAEDKAVAALDFRNAGWRANDAGWIHYLRRQSDAVLKCAGRADAHWDKIGVGASERAAVLRLRGNGHRLAKNYSAAIKSYRQALKGWDPDQRNHIEVALIYDALAGSERLTGDLAAAERHYCKALLIADLVGDRFSIAAFKGNLADVALDRNELPKARICAGEALDLSETLGRLELIAENCHRLAKAHLGEGNSAVALPYARRAVDIFTRLESPDLEAARATVWKCEE